MQPYRHAAVPPHGGRLTVASGRPPASVKAALGDLKLSLPAICCNGSLLYDFSSGQVLRRAALNREQAVAAMLDMAAKFPGIGMEVMAGDGDMYVVQANPYTHAHQGGRGNVRRGLPDRQRAGRLGQRLSLPVTLK